MSQRESPGDQLRVIRALMERATIYRSLSAPTALVGGLLSIGGLVVACCCPLSDILFLSLWGAILLLTCAANTYFLFRGSRRRGENFFSSGMKLAVASLAPAFLGAGVLTWVTQEPIALAVIWIVAYGLGLLATQHFAPRSIVVLGATFFLAGIALILEMPRLYESSIEAASPEVIASALMAGTFGAFHVIYAVAVFALEKRGDGVLSPTTGTGNV